jgi:hypothetical protein
MMQVFEAKTGRFLPLPDDQLATLSPVQLAAYKELEAATTALTGIDSDIEVLVERSRQAQAAVTVAQEQEAKRPKYTPLMAARDAIATWRRQHP